MAELDRRRGGAGLGGGAVGTAGRLPLLDRIRQLRGKALQDQYDVAGWDAVSDELKAQPLSDESRAAYEEILATFPTSVLHWIRYAELELGSNGNEANVKTIFGRCLLTSPNVELWTLYLKFIKRSNEGKGPEGLVEIRRSYEFTLDCIGVDMAAGNLWHEYIQFLSSQELGSSGFAALFPGGIPGQEEQQRAMVLRRAYQRAVVVPSLMCESLWKAYEKWERNGLNKQFATKILEEWRPRHMAAKSALRQRRQKLGDIKDLLPMPPGRGGLYQQHQAGFWQEYLAWERSNVEKLEPAALATRVSLAYDQALIPLWLFPEVWFEYAAWHQMHGGGSAQASQVLVKAHKALPTCVMLRFALADMEESVGALDKATEVYDTLVQHIEASQAAAATSDPTTAMPDPLDLPVDQAALVWIQYMRFLRRTEGDNASRKMFLRARKWQQQLPTPAADTNGHGPEAPPLSSKDSISKSSSSGGSWHIYAAAALMEWQWARDPNIARNIWEKGLEDARLFRSTDYVLQYHKFLRDIGDPENARALFERVLSEEVHRRSPALWQRYVALEAEVGELGTVLEVERRAREALGEGTSAAAAEPLAFGILRYKFLDVWPCTQDQSAHLQRVLGSAPDALIEPVLSTSLGSGSREPLRMPPQLDTFMVALPPNNQLDGVMPDVDRVMDALITLDLTPAAIISACNDLDSGRVFGAGSNAPGPSYERERDDRDFGAPHGGRYGPPPPYDAPPVYDHRYDGPGPPPHYQPLPPHPPPHPYDRYDAPPRGRELGPPGPPYHGPPPLYLDRPPDDRYGYDGPPPPKRRHDGRQGYEMEEDDDTGYGPGPGHDPYRQRLKQRSRAVDG